PAASRFNAADGNTGLPAFAGNDRVRASASSTWERAMSQPTPLITTEQLAAHLSDPNLRLYDCTTYNEPVPPGSDVPYRAVHGDKTFAAGHIPGADCLDLQGEFSDTSAQQFFMMPDVAQLEAAFGRHGAEAS